MKSMSSYQALTDDIQSIRSTGNEHLILLFIFLIPLSSLFTSCSKDWLEEKPNKSLVVPTTIEDYQAILDNNAIFNANGTGLGQASCDDSYITASSWNTLDPIARNSYVWSKDIFQGNSSDEWRYAYERILDANIVLDGIEKVEKSNAEAWNNVKGSALFFRSFDYFNLAQEFCKQYSQASSATDLGLPLRLTSNVNELSVRSNLQQTYDRIKLDLLSAIQLLPDYPAYKTRPSKTACYSLLSRMCLVMGQYEDAKKYADSSLSITSELMDFNELNATTTFPIIQFNNEVIFHNTLLTYFSTFITTAIVDSVLYSSYKEDDLRKTIFFRDFNGATRLWANYTGNIAYNFGGLATDEVYLTRAECRARVGDIPGAMDDLNTLLRARYKKNPDGTSTYVNQTASTEDEALHIILQERRKELLYRGTRWIDLRRLNQDPRFAITLTRVLDGQTYTLPPNDNRYTFPIPPDEIKLSGIEQNPR